MLDSIPLEEIGRVATKSKTGSKKTLIDRIEKHLGVDLDGDGFGGVGYSTTGCTYSGTDRDDTNINVCADTDTDSCCRL